MVVRAVCRDENILFAIFPYLPRSNTFKLGTIGSNTLGKPM